MPKNGPFIFENFRAFGPKNFQVVLKWCQVGLPPTLFSRMTRNEKVKISPNWICTKILIDFFNFVYLAIFWELRHCENNIFSSSAISKNRSWDIKIHQKYISKEFNLWLLPTVLLAYSGRVRTSQNYQVAQLMHRLPSKVIRIMFHWLKLVILRVYNVFEKF